MHLPSIFRLSHTSLRTNSPFFLSLQDSPPLNYILFSSPGFFPMTLTSVILFLLLELGGDEVHMEELLFPLG